MFCSCGKGTLVGNKIVVKTRCPKSSPGINEFEHEIKEILNVKDTNVVSVQGYCVHGKDLMIVYENMHNKSLTYHLHDHHILRQMYPIVPKKSLPQSYVLEASDINPLGSVSIEIQLYTKGEIESEVEDEGILM
uniref:non-specific serine/threonine protein kinase n=1 Tax=Lactuca sativa TaxID=4236 RepID=A0A9R1VDD4_LACSA|nr:hypothetical protein LSAT_V11C500250560 [Lactuca sativa]